jgi:hypothetical protein
VPLGPSVADLDGRHKLVPASLAAVRAKRAHAPVIEQNQLFKVSVKLENAIWVALVLLLIDGLPYSSVCGQSNMEALNVIQSIT